MPDSLMLILHLRTRRLSLYHYRNESSKDEGYSSKMASYLRWLSRLHAYRFNSNAGGDFTGRPVAVKGEQNKDGVDPEDQSNSFKSGALVGSTGLSKTAQKILRIQKQPPAPTLFLGNLGFEATDKSIRELFEAHRVAVKKPKTKEQSDDDDDDERKTENDPIDKWIRKIRMGTFEDTGNCKG